MNEAETCLQCNHNYYLSADGKSCEPMASKIDATVFVKSGSPILKSEAQAFAAQFLAMKMEGNP